MTEIGKDYAFNFCRQLAYLHVDADVASIGKHAFYGCPKLEKVEIGDSVLSIGANGFAACTALTDVYWDAPQWYWETMIPIGDNNIPLHNANQNYIEDIPVAEAVRYPSGLPGETVVESYWAPLPVEIFVFCAAYDPDGKLMDVQEMTLPPALSVEAHYFYLNAEAPAEVRLFSVLSGSFLPFTTYVEAVSY